MGGITEIRHVRTGVQLDSPELRGTAGGDAQAQWATRPRSSASVTRCRSGRRGPLGPFDAWPSGRRRIRALLRLHRGETNQYAPALYDGTTPVEPDRTPEEGYHLTEDMTDRAIDCAPAKALMPDSRRSSPISRRVRRTRRTTCRSSGRTGTRAASTQAGTRCARRPSHGRRSPAIPPEADLTDRPEEIPAWDDMSDDLKPVLARQMEVYAGFLEHTDHHIGWLVDALTELEILDDTLIYYIVGDNGASGEGTPQGTFNETIPLNGAVGIETTEYGRADRPVRHDRRQQPLRGRPGACDGHAFYQWTKQVAHWAARATARSSTGRTASPPRRSARPVQPRDRRGGDGARRGRPGRADVRPRRTADAAARTKHGPDLRRPAAPEHRGTQYFEMFVNRGIYHKGWTAVTRHSIPWLMAETPPIDADVWELYAPDDWTQAHDLAGEQPEKPAELQRLFLIEAARYNVLLDDPPCRTLQRRHRRPPAAHPRKVLCPLRGHGPAVGELGPRPEE